jgi:hypothetical protein
MWLSDDFAKTNWKSWCQAEEYRFDRLAYKTEVLVDLSDNILLLDGSSVEAVKAFHAKYKFDTYETRFYENQVSSLKTIIANLTSLIEKGKESGIDNSPLQFELHRVRKQLYDTRRKEPVIFNWIDWSVVMKDYKGILISPYDKGPFSLLGKHRHLLWYDSVDCASACIWDITCIIDTKASLKMTDLIAKEPTNDVDQDGTMEEAKMVSTQLDEANLKDHPAEDEVKTISDQIRELVQLSEGGLKTDIVVFKEACMEESRKRRKVLGDITNTESRCKAETASTVDMSSRDGASNNVVRKMVPSAVSPKAFPVKRETKTLKGSSDDVFQEKQKPTVASKALQAQQRVTSIAITDKQEEATISQTVQEQPKVINEEFDAKATQELLRTPRKDADIKSPAKPNTAMIQEIPIKDKEVTNDFIQKEAELENLPNIVSPVKIFRIKSAAGEGPHEPQFQCILVVLNVIFVLFVFIMALYPEPQSME